MNVLSLLRRRPGWAVFAVVGLLAAAGSAVVLTGCTAKTPSTPAQHEHGSTAPAPSTAPAAPAMQSGNPPQNSATAAAPSKVMYVCPMHPEVQQDKPGKCPICGMDLVKKEIPQPKSTEPNAVAPAHPAPSSGTKDEMDHEMGQAGPPPGLAPVHTDQDRAQLAGIRTAVATTDSIVTTVRAVGTVAADETRVRHVTTKVAGWVEKLYVNAIGQYVKAGQPLFELYSPELLASQEEYLRALQVVEQFANSSLPEVRKGAEELVSASRRRLELFDVPSDFLQELDRTRRAQRTVLLRAPFSGYVSEKNVLEGHKVEAGADLLTLTDLSRVWVTAQVYEAEAGSAQNGRTATVTLPYDSGVVLRGRVDLVYPTVDPETRTIKLRLEFPNTGLTLKPGMFVNVALETSRATGVVVPDSAVIDSGTRQVAFVEAEPGHFEPRDVQVGTRGDGKALLRSGVRAGERVAIAANFLLDSESRLRGAVAGTASTQPSQHQHQQ